MKTVAWLVVLGAIGGAAPGFVAAQSCSEPAPTTVFVGTPTNASTGVPTNVAFFYKIPARLGAPTPGMFLLHAGAKQIALHAERVRDAYLELTPDAPLEPNQSHQLSGTWGVSDTTDDALLFWTGDGPFQGPPAQPEVRLQQYRVGADVAEAKCASPRLGTCLAFGAPATVVEYTVIDADGTEHAPAIALGAALVDLTGLDPEQPARCVRLRARGPDGSYSEPVRVCGDDYPVWQADRALVTCGSDGLGWEGMPAEPRLVRQAHASDAVDAGAPLRTSAADGCSVRQPARASGWRALVGMAGVVGVARLRRRRSLRRQLGLTSVDVR